MKSTGEVIPVVLFTYARPAHVARALECLRENGVPLLRVYADGARGAADARAVADVRALLAKIDWCEAHVTERPGNLGLGRNVLAGVTEVAAQHDAFIVWEDDLVAVPGAYAWMCAALRHFAADSRVMSVTGWTHPRVTPPGLGPQPYFDARAESWSWGAWRRSWAGMAEENARQKLAALRDRGMRPGTIGGDLVDQVDREEAKNLWAARWLCHHLLHDGLCVRPPWSMVEHAGFDASATNAPVADGWSQALRRPAPPIPATWPAPTEHPACRGLWRAAYPSGWNAWPSRFKRILRRTLGER